jgi:hypothetical protein
MGCTYLVMLPVPAGAARGGYDCGEKILELGHVFPEKCTPAEAAMSVPRCSYLIHLILATSDCGPLSAQ